LHKRLLQRGQLTPSNWPAAPPNPPEYGIKILLQASQATRRLDLAAMPASRRSDSAMTSSPVISLRYLPSGKRSSSDSGYFVMHPGQSHTFQSQDPGRSKPRLERPSVRRVHLIASGRNAFLPQPLVLFGSNTQGAPLYDIFSPHLMMTIPIPGSPLRPNASLSSRLTRARR
jgi:hypothetical protein